jgi:ABC-2 type transport system permease protein
VNTAAQTLALSRRAVVGLIRQPQVVVPSLFFPLFFTALNSAAFERATNLPQFPDVDSFLDFLLPATILQGVIFGATSAGVEMATDVQNGFFDRLLTSPVSRISILIGRLAGGATLGGVQALVFVAVLLPFGASVKGGVLGLLVLILVGMLLGLGIGGFGVAMGLRTGSAEAVQGSFPLLFVLMFTSSAFFPRELMTGWYQDVAGINPISWMVEGLRELVTEDFSVEPAARAVLIAASLGVATVTLSLGQLRRRLREAS